MGARHGQSLGIYIYIYISVAAELWFGYRAWWSQIALIEPRSCFRDRGQQARVEVNLRHSGPNCKSQVPVGGDFAAGGLPAIVGEGGIAHTYEAAAPRPNISAVEQHPCWQP